MHEALRNTYNGQLQIIALMDSVHLVLRHYIGRTQIIQQTIGYDSSEEFHCDIVSSYPKRNKNATQLPKQLLRQSFTCERSVYGG